MILWTRCKYGVICVPTAAEPKSRGLDGGECVVMGDSAEVGVGIAQPVFPRASNLEAWSLKGRVQSGYADTYDEIIRSLLLCI